MSPALLPHLLWNTVFLKLTDVADALPPYFEEIEFLCMSSEQREVHQAFKADLSAEVERQLACGSKKLLGAYLQSLLHHPDTPWREEAVWSTDENGVPYLVAEAEALDDGVVYPKEQRLLDIAQAEKRQGRRLLVFVQGTDRRDITRRLFTLLEDSGLKAAVLKSHTTSAKKREAWVAKEVEKVPSTYFRSGDDALREAALATLSEAGQGIASDSSAHRAKPRVKMFRRNRAGVLARVRWKSPLTSACMCKNP